MIPKFIYVNVCNSHLLILTAVKSCIAGTSPNLCICFVIDEHLGSFQLYCHYKLCYYEYLCAKFLKVLYPGEEWLVRYCVRLKIYFPKGLYQFTLPPRVCDSLHHSHPYQQLILGFSPVLLIRNSFSLFSLPHETTVLPFSSSSLTPFTKVIKENLLEMQNHN